MRGCAEKPPPAKNRQKPVAIFKSMKGRDLTPKSPPRHGSLRGSVSAWPAEALDGGRRPAEPRTECRIARTLLSGCQVFATGSARSAGGRAIAGTVRDHQPAEAEATAECQISGHIRRSGGPKCKVFRTDAPRAAMAIAGAGQRAAVPR